MKSPHRITVVEDSETQALKLQNNFEKEGWQASICTTAEAALDEFNKQLPDLIVVDYYLPGMRGDELCKRIRMNVNTRGIPILMLTSEQTDNAELIGLDSGADDYISKAEDPEILLLRIRALLRKSTIQSSILEPSDAYFRKARLLVIDDSLTYLEYLSQELHSEGYSVVKTSSGLEGLKRVTEENFDCVLVDLVMPEMDGIDVCGQLTELRRTLDNPIVVLMLTAREDKSDMTRGLEAGADDFVGKSNDMAVIKARIRALLRRKFFQEENRRIIEELKNKEMEAIRAKAEKEVAETRAAMVEKLEQANQELEQTNRKLKETQSHLIQSEKMASLGQLVAGIAHEINNPLTFVNSNIFTVKDRLQKINQELEDNLNEKTKKMMAKALTRLDESAQGLERVKELVLNLRTFSRLDEGEFKTVDIPESIESVLMFLSHKLKSGIEVTKDYGPVRELPCYAGQLNQVLLNLLANAADAIEGSGRIGIKTRQADNHFEISVQDTGKGIPKEIQNRIFEPFFTTKPVGEGTGLGLSISYGIIEAHRGQIDVHSDEGKGTEFVIRIPSDLAQNEKAKTGASVTVISQ